MKLSLIKTIATTVATLSFAVAASVSAKPLLVAVDTAFVPFEFKQGDQYVGFDIDMWDTIAKDLGLEYKLQPMDFSGILPALQTNNIDAALAGITITEERRKAIDFSDGYYDSGFILMVGVDSDIKSPEDLKGKTLSLKTGTSAANYAKEHFKDTTLRQFPNIDNAYLELQTGRVDAAMHDTPNVLYYIKEAGQGRVKTVGDQMLAHEYGIAFPKGSKIIPQVNEVLAKMKTDGRYDAIYEKWFGTKPVTASTK